MSKPKVLVTSDAIPDEGIKLLAERCDILTVEDPTKSKIISKVKNVDALFWATKVRLDEDIIEASGSNLKVVACMSVGYNHVDVKELKKRGIKLSNTPGVMDRTVAETAVLLALAASRRLQEGRRKIETNQWVTGHPQWMLGQDVAGSVVGIVGLGGIGQAAVKILKGFDVSRFLYTGHKEKPEGKELGAEFVPFDTLVKDSDFVIISCPLTEETTDLFNASVFAKMKKTAVLVNVARGEVVKQEDLVEALRNRTIFAAGLDVTTPEPLPIDHQLLKLENCVVLPHLGSATLKTREAAAVLAARNILKALDGEELLTPVY